MARVKDLTTPYVCPALMVNMFKNKNTKVIGNKGKPLDSLIHTMQRTSPHLRVEQLLQCVDDDTRGDIEGMLNGETVINTIQYYRQELKNVRYSEEIVWQAVKGRPQFLFESYDLYMAFIIKQNSSDHFVHKHVGQMQMYMEILNKLYPGYEIKGKIGFIDIDKVMDVEAKPEILNQAVEQKKMAFKVLRGKPFHMDPAYCSGVCCAYNGRCVYNRSSK